MKSHMSQREAAKSWGVSRITIQRYIKDGKLSLSSDKRIDPAEMLRVFGEPQNSQSSPDGATPLLGRIEALTIENATAKAELAGLRELLASKEANLADLRSQVLLLTHDGTARRKRWRWPFGR